VAAAPARQQAGERGDPAAEDEAGTAAPMITSRW